MPCPSQTSRFSVPNYVSDPEHQYGTIIVVAPRHVLCEIFRSKGVISLWGIIKQHVSKHRYQTIEDLKQAVREAFRKSHRLGAASFCAATMMAPY
ncbi:hypothetical protein ANN_22153 [Periplaneta americana]|uniref:Uncharacterized protein n=1 Tax=Periplaneta americana TaxID=6978 RepID=A0ABQ8S7U7_PERAM|nr:hypothetical protein ANN_22153 [Periplaneta americana]